ncbi:MAG: isoprenylcysteine carboxylmethyltransferase family protein [Myxococcota bacterium]
MDAFRYWLAVVLWVSFLPALGFWLLVHPFVGFWRRLGPAVSYGVLLTLVAAGMASAYAVREWVLAVDFGTSGWTVGVGVVFLLAAAAARWPIERTLTTRALLGLPELSPERHPTALATTGPYAWVRHPRYVQVSTALLGWALLANYLVGYVLLVLWIPALLAVVALEERELRDRFGSAWEDYARRVPRFLPRRP